MPIRFVRELLKRSPLGLFLLLSSLPAISQAGSKPDLIVAQENAFWKAYAAGNATDLAPLLRADFTNVEQEIWTRDQVLTFVTQFHKQCSLAPVVLADPHVSFLSPDIATVVYHAIESATCGAQTMSGDSVCITAPGTVIGSSRKMPR